MCCALGNILKGQVVCTLEVLEEKKSIKWFKAVIKSLPKLQGDDAKIRGSAGVLFSVGISSQSVFKCVSTRSATLHAIHCSTAVWWSSSLKPTFHPVNHLTGAPLAHGLHNQCHGRSLPSRLTKENETLPANQVPT